MRMIKYYQLTEDNLKFSLHNLNKIAKSYDMEISHENKSTHFQREGSSSNQDMP
jgi:hypothetical protein